MATFYQGPVLSRVVNQLESVFFNLDLPETVIYTVPSGVYAEFILTSWKRISTGNEPGLRDFVWRIRDNNNNIVASVTENINFNDPASTSTIGSLSYPEEYKMNNNNIIFEGYTITVDMIGGLLNFNHDFRTYGLIREYTAPGGLIDLS